MTDGAQRIADYVYQRFREFEAEDFRIFTRLPCLSTTRYARAFLSLSEHNREEIRRAISLRAVQWWGFQCPSSEKAPCIKAYGKFRDMSPYPSDLVEHGSVRAPAVALRKAAKLMFGQLLGCTPTKSTEPGDWIYPGTLLDRPVEIQVRYSTRIAPLWYGMNINGTEARHSFCLENLFGLGIGDWDNIRLNQEDEAFALLRGTILAGMVEYKRISQLLLP